MAETIFRFGEISTAFHIRVVKNVIARYLDHADPLVRYTAMFCLGYHGRCRELAGHFLDAVGSDAAGDNRGCAAFCLGAVLSGTRDLRSLGTLARLVLDDHEDQKARLQAYGGMLMIYEGESVHADATSFFAGDKQLHHINLAWVRYHALESKPEGRLSI